MNTDQTSPIGAVGSGFIVFVSTIKEAWSESENNMQQML